MSAAVTLARETLSGGWPALRLANEHLEVVLLPDKGSEIYTLRDRASGVDLLWKSPWGLRPPPVRAATGPDSVAAWMDHYGGGWQELFPNAGDPCTYAGAPLPFHGEASVAPWSWHVEETDGGPAIRLAFRCARSPFRLEKRISLDPERPILRLWERVTNEGSERMPFMWGHHPAFGAPFLAGGCLIDVPANTFEAAAPQGGTRTWLEPGGVSSWPLGERPDGGVVDLSVVPGPQERVANLGFIRDLREGWYALTNPHLELGVALVWPQEVFPYLWLWQELGGSDAYPWYGTNYVMGIEPHTSVPAQGLLPAIERGTARWLGAGEQLEMELLAVVYRGHSRVRQVTPSGEVITAGPVEPVVTGALVVDVVPEAPAAPLVTDTPDAPAVTDAG